MRIGCAERGCTPRPAFFRAVGPRSKGVRGLRRLGKPVRQRLAQTGFCRDDKAYRGFVILGTNAEFGPGKSPARAQNLIVAVEPVCGRVVDVFHRAHGAPRDKHLVPRPCHQASAADGQFQASLGHGDQFVGPMDEPVPFPPRRIDEEAARIAAPLLARIIHERGDFELAGMV